MTRTFRGATYDIRIERGSDRTVVKQDGVDVAGGVLPVPEWGAHHEIVCTIARESAR
jgi:hypothetical protein